MTASVQDHCHLVSSASPGDSTTSGEWTITATGLKPKLVPRYGISASPRRSLDGTLHPHVLKSGGVPLMTTDWSFEIRCDSLADETTLSAYLGTTMYFIPPNHDAAAHNSYTQAVFVSSVGPATYLGPMLTVIHVPMNLLDAS